MTPDPQVAPERATHESRGYCPVCGTEVVWISTAHLWPTKRAAQSVRPSHGGTCSRCQRVLVFTVLNDPQKGPDGTTG